MAATADLAAAIEAARPETEPAREAPPEAVSASAMELAEAMAAGTAPSAEPELATAGDAPAPRRGAGRALLQLLMASAMASGGAGAGYYGAMVQQQDMLTWTAAGAAIGLLLGWMSVRWMARTR
ncbi:MAG: hypothetical protein GWN71_36295 [Gammaproteobacteria bacterium]|nr:hypothetical protein [Gemmatimonadota bacterium]NIU78818.1 hypothetical protein [Gammaproteobacteria bacterium]